MSNKMPKFKKPSSVWRWAAKNLEQTQCALYKDGAYCALGAIAKGIGIRDEDIRYVNYSKIFKFDNLEGLEYDLVNIYDLKIIDLNDMEDWDFDQFATVAKMLGY